jgi:hypothetical protein
MPSEPCIPEEIDTGLSKPSCVVPASSATTQQKGLETLSCICSQWLRQKRTRPHNSRTTAYLPSPSAIEGLLVGTALSNCSLRCHVTKIGAGLLHPPPTLRDPVRSERLQLAPALGDCVLVCLLIVYSRLSQGATSRDAVPQQTGGVSLRYACPPQRNCLTV